MLALTLGEGSGLPPMTSIYNPSLLGLEVIPQSRECKGGPKGGALAAKTEGQAHGGLGSDSFPRVGWSL